MLTLTKFEIRSSDGGPPIRGDVRVRAGHRPTAAVVICHGFKGFRAANFFPGVARAAAAHGFAAVSFDFSRNGVGADGEHFTALELFADQTHSRNVQEIRQVLNAVSSGILLPRPPRKIGLFGHSRGGGEAVLAAAEDPRVAALVTWAAIADVASRWTDEQVNTWRAGGTVHVENSRTKQMMPIGPAYWRDYEANRGRLDIPAAAAQVSVPWLIVHGDADSTVPVDDGRALFDAAGDAAELLVIEGGDHTFGGSHPYPGATPELRTAAEATLEWFGTHLA
jgi:dienelactone hydrolase